MDKKDKPEFDYSTSTTTTSSSRSSSSNSRRNDEEMEDVTVDGAERRCTQQERNGIRCHDLSCRCCYTLSYNREIRKRQLEAVAKVLRPEIWEGTLEPVSVKEHNNDISSYNSWGNYIKQTHEVLGAKLLAQMVNFERSHFDRLREEFERGKLLPDDSPGRQIMLYRISFRDGVRISLIFDFNRAGLCFLLQYGGLSNVHYLPSVPHTSGQMMHAGMTSVITQMAGWLSSKGLKVDNSASAQLLMMGSASALHFVSSLILLYFSGPDLHTIDSAYRELVAAYTPEQYNTQVASLHNKRAFCACCVGLMNQGLLPEFALHDLVDRHHHALLHRTMACFYALATSENCRTRVAVEDKLRVCAGMPSGRSYTLYAAPALMMNEQTMYDGTDRGFRRNVLDDISASKIRKCMNTPGPSASLKRNRDDPDSPFGSDDEDIADVDEGSENLIAKRRCFGTTNDDEASSSSSSTFSPCPIPPITFAPSPGEPPAMTTTTMVSIVADEEGGGEPSRRAGKRKFVDITSVCEDWDVPVPPALVPSKRRKYLGDYDVELSKASLQLEEIGISNA